MLRHVQAQRQSGQLSEFEPGEKVLLAGVRKVEGAPKLVLMWTGPWRVMSGGSRLMYKVQDIVTSKTRNVQMTPTRSYADASEEIGSEVRNI